jgi:hypothetical protein
MYDLTLARLIHEERQREIARNVRARAARRALEPCETDVYVPPERPTRIAHPLRPASAGGPLR